MVISSALVTTGALRIDENIRCILEAVALRNSDVTTLDLIVAISVSNIPNASFLYSTSGSRWP